MIVGLVCDVVVVMIVELVNGIVVLGIVVGFEVVVKEV